MIDRAPCEYRQLGSSDLVVSEIALGTWLTFGGGDRATGRRARSSTRAFELGITLIDTANVYNRGAAETFLGEVLAARPRDSYVLATKLYFPMSDEDRGLSGRRCSSRSTLRSGGSAPISSISTSATATTRRRLSRRRWRR